MRKPQITWYFLIIALVLVGGFAWLEFNRPEPLNPPTPQAAKPVATAKPKLSYKIVPQSEMGTLPPPSAAAAEGFVIKAKKSKNKTEDSAGQSEMSSEELLEKLRKQGSAGEVEVSVVGPKDDLTEEQFQELLNQVRHGKGRWFSKRFEVDTIWALRRRGYNPDGTLIKADSDSP